MHSVSWLDVEVQYGTPIILDLPACKNEPLFVCGGALLVLNLNLDAHNAVGWLDLKLIDATCYEVFNMDLHRNLINNEWVWGEG